MEVLLAVKPGLAKKEIVEQTTHFIFTGDRVVTYNDRVCVSHPFETDFQCSVIAKEFYDVLSDVKEEILTVELQDKQLKLSSGKTRLGLQVMESGTLESTIEQLGAQDESRIWRRIPEDFIQGLFLCLFSASTNLTHKNLSCLYVHADRVLSSDNNRISRYEMNGRVRSSFLLPLSSAQDLVKYDIQSMCLDESWAHFKTANDAIFSARLYLSDIPYPEEAMGEHLVVDGSTFTLPKELGVVVQEMFIATQGREEADKEIRVTMGEGDITCRGELAQGKGWLEKDVDFPEYKGGKISFAVQPVFFAQVLAKTTTMTLGDNRALFESGQKFKHVMLLHIPKPAGESEKPKAAGRKRGRRDS